jgi:hypothetical protein
MLIFLASIVFLLMLIALGERAGAHLWHGGATRYLDHCATCGISYPRPAGLQRVICPHGHVMTHLIAEPHTQTRRGLVFIAICAGFVVVAIILTAAGFVTLP